MHESNERVLRMISEYLCFMPTAIGHEDVTILAAECGIGLNDAYMALLAAHCGLDTALAEDARLYREWFPQMVRMENPEKYLADEYMRRVQPAEGRCGSIDLVRETLQPMELFVTDDFREDGEGRIFPKLGWFMGEFSFPAIREDERVWMTVTPNEINTIQPVVRQSRGKVLTYGLGLGYYAFHCLLRPEVSSVTVVEKNAQVISVFRELILPHFPRQQDLRIVEADAFKYAADVAPGEGYDTVFTDLWHDVADGLPLYRRMKALETPGPAYHYWIEPTLRCYMD
ncbi:MAG: hypothetical protein IJE07_11815 [Clostridia bacterium]|nr:hypothetical protein [Clostridia bacterium]